MDPQVLGPLLVWAIRFVDDLADDIMAAWAEHRRLTSLAAENRSTPAGLAALRAFLAAGETALPAAEAKGAISLARTFIAAVTGASLRQVDYLNEMQGLTAQAAQRPGLCPLQVPVTGRINNKPWRESMDFAEAQLLIRHLGTAQSHAEDESTLWACQWPASHSSSSARTEPMSHRRRGQGVRSSAKKSDIRART
ncbi:hypothetical protein ACFW9N_39075 [Streptomyces sp. NPDC059496]|uniref:hypothetical protein n=1 Tax=Streptomyces sp. NPDC059496 TaxID=3346851 RepID=UPI0036A3FCE6